MIERISFFSLERARAIQPTAQAVMISILDRSERKAHAAPAMSGYRDVLSLQFEDSAEEGKLRAAWAWPDDPSADEHSAACQGVGERIPTLLDAKEILKFVSHHHAADEPFALILHCKAGVSRSAAVAIWAGEFTGASVSPPIAPFQEWANPRVLRLLRKAASIDRSTASVRTSFRP